MDIVAMVIAGLVGVALLAVAIAHLMWSVGIVWPIRDPVLLARSVSGVPDVARMPPRYRSFGIFVLALVACVIAFSAADHTSGGPGLTGLAVLAGLIFLGRGAVGYSRWWIERTPGEPFRTLDRKNYSPLCLAIGVGLLVLVVMRLI